jgi:hypothetical protein
MQITNGWTVTFAITFASGWTGKKIWEAAVDRAGGSSQWQEVDGWPTLPPLTNLRICLANPARTQCTLQAGTHTVSASTGPIDINRSNVIVRGNSGDRTRTKLVRDPSFTEALIQINAPNFTTPGITLQNFTICGGLDIIRDINTQTDVNLGTSALCPRQQTTPGFTSVSCGDMVHRITTGQPRPPNLPPPSKDFVCTDVEVKRADTGEYQANPFPSTSNYSLTIANVDLEDAAGHALALWEEGVAGSHVNDVYIHDSAIVGSAVTGILYGSNAPEYHTQLCDTNSNWLNDRTVFAPRNLRIENNTFSNNNTGADRRQLELPANDN